MPDAPLPGAAPDRRVNDLLAVLEVARRLAATTDLQPLLEAVVHSTIRVLDCERASVFLHDPRTDELYSRVATEALEARFPAKLGIAGETLRTGQVQRIDDAYADPRFNPAIDRQTGFRTRSILSCPLVGWDNVPLGVLQALNKRGGPFGDWDETLVLALGAQAGVAVQRRRLLDELAEKQRLQRDLEVARMIQQGLLPAEAPRLPGYDVAGWNRPADLTGGDYFDFQLVAGNKLALAVADATGHGIGPALMAAECRALARAAWGDSDDLAGTVARVNRLLCADLPEGKLVTAFFGLLDPAAHRLRYLSAGQGPVLLLRAATGAVEELPPQGVPLGVMPDFPYDVPGDVALGPGDCLALFTDGFFEWPDPAKQPFGPERVQELLRAHRQRPATEMIRLVHEAVGAFTRGTPQRDDLTAVIVKRC